MQLRTETSSARTVVFCNRQTNYHLLSFLSLADHHKMAEVNRTFSNFQAQFYQLKLVKLEHQLNPTVTKGETPSIPFPTSAYLWESCNLTLTAPTRFIERMRALNKESRGDQNPIILLAEGRIYRLEAFEKLPRNYQLIDVLVKVCGYDLNYIDDYGKTILNYLLQLNNQYSRDKKMIRYCLASPTLTKGTATSGFLSALSNSYASIEDNLRNISIKELLDSKKINLSDPRIAQEIACSEGWVGNPDLTSFKAYLALFQQYEAKGVAPLCFDNIIPTILVRFGAKSLVILKYLLENKLINLESICKNEASPVPHLIRHVGKDPAAFLKILDLFEKHFPNIEYPKDLLEQIVNSQGEKLLSEQRPCVLGIMTLLKHEKVQKKLALTSDILKAAQKCARFELLQAYLGAKALLAKINEDKSEYQGGITLFSINIGGISNQKRKEALHALIEGLENPRESKPSLNFFAPPSQPLPLNLPALVKAHPVLNEDGELKKLINLVEIAFISVNHPFQKLKESFQLNHRNAGL